MKNEALAKWPSFGGEALSEVQSFRRGIISKSILIIIIINLIIFFVIIILIIIIRIIIVSTWRAGVGSGSGHLRWPDRQPKIMYF